MKLIIAGGRSYRISKEDVAKLDAILAESPDLRVVHGGCSGVDSYAHAWATKHARPIHVFPADWEKHGKAACPIRNRQMAEYADAVALFPGDRGTKSMYDEAVKAGIRIYDFRQPTTGESTL